MADSLPNLSLDAARAAEPKRRFQRRPPSAETLQEIYEQNVLGATAGFFCAVWAGRLMGEHFSSTFTTVGYEDVDRPHYHHFGAKDVALVVLVASKLLFARICVIRYILRPLLNARLSGWDFTRRVQLAAAAYTVLVQLLSVGAGLWTCYPILGGRRMVYEPLASVSVGTKLAVVVQCALQIAEVAVQLVEDSDHKSMLHAKLGALLTLGTISASSYQGLVPVAGAAAAATGLSWLAAAIWRVGCLLDSDWAWSRQAQRVASAALAAALCICPAYLLYLVMLATRNSSSAGQLPASMDLLLEGLVAVQALLSLQSAGQILQREIGFR